MSRHQVWDNEGNLIVDEEVADEVEQAPNLEELSQVVTELTTTLNEKGLIP